MTSAPAAAPRWRHAAARRLRRRAQAAQAVCRALVLAAMGLAAGCAAVGVDRAAQLRDAVSAYNDALRWGRHERAASYLPPAERAAFVAAKRAAGEALQVHDVEVRAVQQGADGRSAQVRVLLTFSRLGDPRLEAHVVDQRWRWTAEAGWWLIERQRVEQATGPLRDPASLY